MQGGQLHGAGLHRCGYPHDGQRHHPRSRWQGALYNITVYVPNQPLAPLVDGPSCDPCDPLTGTSLLSGEPIAVAKTDVSGAFTFGDVPVGANIPLVIQVGKWRREITIDNVPACVDTPLTMRISCACPATRPRDTSRRWR